MAAEYEKLTLDYLEGAINVMKKSFYVHENISKALGLNKSTEAMDEWDEFLFWLAKQGVSVIATDTANQVVGVAFNRLLQNPPVDDFYETYIEKCKHRASKAVMEFKINAENFHDDLFELCNIDCLMDVMFIAVLPEFWKQGIAENLCRKSLDIARKLKEDVLFKPNYDGAVIMLCSSIKTQKIAKKLGFRVLKFIYYDDLKFEGKKYSDLLDFEEFETRFMALEYLKV